MKSILVTGATGYIGSQFLKKFQDNYDLLVLVRSTSDFSILKDVKYRVVYYSHNSELLKLLANEHIDGIVHFASHVVSEHTQQDIEPMIQSNITLGTLLLELCRQNKIPWFINTGTFWQHYHSNGYNPVNLYAASKEAFEKIATYYMSDSNFTFVTIKLMDIYGPHDPRGKILSLWQKMLKSKEALSMSAGEQIVNMVYIDDLLDAYKIVIDLLEDGQLGSTDNLVYSVRSMEQYSLRQVSEIFEDVTQTKLPIEWGAKPYRAREVMKPWSDGVLVPTWSPKTSLREGIEKMIEMGEL